jgi:minor curlin subunit
MKSLNIVSTLSLSGLLLISFNSNAFSEDLAYNELRNLSELQSGFDNVAVVNLNNATNSNATIIQKSFGNHKGNAAKIKQQGNDNNATIGQIGNGNRAYINQNGYNNEAAILQAGLYNDGIIIQNGDNNTAYLVQKGYGNEKVINQQNNDNTAYVVEKNNVRHSDYSVNQNGNDHIIIVNGMNKHISVN